MNLITRLSAMDGRPAIQILSSSTLFARRRIGGLNRSSVAKRPITAVIQKLAGAGLAFATQVALAQTWQTVDSFQYVAGSNAMNSGLAVAPSGVILASGFGNDGSTDHGLVMASADGGNTWSAPLDDFVYPGSRTRDDGVTADSAGNIYVAGRYLLASPGPEYRFVRRSADGGASWATVDTVVTPGVSRTDSDSPSWAGGSAITADSSGNVYVTESSVGNIYVSSTNFGAWVVRKGIGGTNYSTVDTFQPSNSQAYSVFAHPTAGVFAAGFGTLFSKSSSSRAWMIRRSLDAGATWQTVDSYQLRSGIGATVYGVGADGKANLYAVGEAIANCGTSSAAHWIIRKSSDGGTTWKTVDDYQLASCYDSAATGFCCDTNGNLFVAGLGSTFYGYHWIVRESVGGTGAWATVNDVSFSPSLSQGWAAAIAADRLGNVFAAGTGNPTNTSGMVWIVQKN